MTSQNGNSGQTTQTIEPSEPGQAASEKPRPIRLMIAIPSGGDWKKGFGWALARAATHFAFIPYDGEKSIQFEVVGGPMLPENRRRLVARAYELDATHILWLDDDMKFPADTIPRLLNHNLPVVAVNYPRKNFIDPKPTAYADFEDFVGPVWTGSKSEGLQQVTVAGMGVMLTDIRVFEKISPPIFAFEPQKPDLVQDSGEDVFFCRELHRLEIPIFIDHDLSKECAHIGDLEFTNMLAQEAEIVKQALYKDLK
jgi:hypothetical protein